MKFESVIKFEDGEYYAGYFKGLKRERVKLVLSDFIKDKYHRASEYRRYAINGVIKEGDMYVCSITMARPKHAKKSYTSHKSTAEEKGNPASNKSQGGMGYNSGVEKRAIMEAVQKALAKEDLERIAKDKEKPKKKKRQKHHRYIKTKKGSDFY